MLSRRCTVLFVFFTQWLFAQNYNYPELEFLTAETEHFYIHYHQNMKETGEAVTLMAEQVYKSVTDIYQFRPNKKTHVFVRDDEDTSNGFAVYHLDHITLWSMPSQLRLRARREWLRGVFVHEFSHVVSLQASTSLGHSIEGIRLGAVLNGKTDANTDLGVSALVPTFSYPRWWAEGTAQLDTALIGADAWDSLRDMTLRSAVLEDNMLTFDEMRNITVRSGYDGELVYNQGFAFLQWLSKKYGTDINQKISMSLRDHPFLLLDGVLKKLTHEEPRHLYELWKADLNDHYQKQVGGISERKKGSPLLFRDEDLSDEDDKDKNGLSTSDVRFSPDGKWLSYIDKSTLHILPLTAPYQLDLGDETRHKEMTTPASYYAWNSQSNKLIVSRKISNTDGGYPRFKLFEIAIHSEIKDLNPRTLEINDRATQPAFHPRENKFVYVAYSDGKTVLKSFDMDTKSVATLVEGGPLTQALDPSWSFNGNKLAFTFIANGKSRLGLWDSATGSVTYVVDDDYDNRDPCFSSQTNTLYFSSDRTGVFQIYSINLNETPSTSTLTQHTHVRSGAFMPSPDEKRLRLLYVLYTAHGFKAYQTPLSSSHLTITSTTNSESTSPENDVVIFQERIKVFEPTENTQVPDLKRTDSIVLRPVRIFPTAVFENDEMKAGASATLSDHLNRHEWILSGLFGHEIDIQAGYYNRVWTPTFYINYTGFVRRSTVTLLNDGDGISDEAETNFRDNIHFVTAGLQRDFRTSLLGRAIHTLGTEYRWRFAQRHLGVPLVANGRLENDLNLIQNHTAHAYWRVIRGPKNYRVRPDQDVNPQNQIVASLDYSLIHSKLYAPNANLPAPNQFYFHHEVLGVYEQYFGMPSQHHWIKHHTLWFRSQAGWKSRDVDSNDEFYLGGRINFRAFGQIVNQVQFYGYEDFSISGETLLLQTVGYTLPLVRRISTWFHGLYLDSLYASFYTDIGNVWAYKKIRNASNGSILLQDVGAELKLKSYLFNDWNRFSTVFRVAYGLQDNAQHGFSNSDLPIRIYVGVGTDF